VVSDVRELKRQGIGGGIGMGSEETFLEFRSRYSSELLFKRQYDF
jgi:hypothetical protein